MRGWTRSIAVMLVAALVATIVPYLADLSVGSTPIADAAVPAPIGSMPDCSEDDSPNIGDDCLSIPSEGISVSASGTLAEGGFINFVTTLDAPACAAGTN